MTKPIELGLILKGEDAQRFHRYMENPEYSKDGKDMIRRAAKLAEKKRANTIAD
ncbi:hypothetical protein [Methanoplanus endosymbiosus]|jgi:uncharacterized protein (DUF1778 family)|uniref:Uncharacterized protein n=1 Tax=Methanoplanus endosymbiosus TaxID=33865 RepID=A0A9E7PLD1_9EURY|nr:hypothetical protein [Methanoplanus endosymbiosus]UUX92284.1 hypothetical protein L6E24_13210 [Methanoplanus endosymbiosus]